MVRVSYELWLSKNENMKVQHITTRLLALMHGNAVYRWPSLSHAWSTAASAASIKMQRTLSLASHTSVLFYVVITSRQFVVAYYLQKTCRHNIFENDKVLKCSKYLF